MGNNGLSYKEDANAILNALRMCTLVNRYQTDLDFCLSTSTIRDKIKIIKSIF